MNWLIIFIIGVLGMQIALFFYIRAKKKAEKKNSVVDKYNIKSSGDAFNLLNDNSIPEEDRKKIEELYRGSN